MEGLWIIFVIVALVYRFLNKAGEISGEMKGRLPEGFGEKRFPPVIKDWGFPWDEENEGDEDNAWGEYPGLPDKGVHSRENTGKNVSIETPTEAPREPARENIMETQANLQQEQGAAGFDKYPFMDNASLINGLILSEILQPPKSRRVGRRS